LEREARLAWGCRSFAFDRALAARVAQMKSDFLVEPIRASGRGISLDRDAPCVRSRFRHVIGELHPEKVIHVRAERLFDAQGHFRRQRGLAVQKIGERSAAHFQNLSRLRHGEAESFDDSVLIRSPGWADSSWAFGLLVVVDQVNIAGGVCLFVVVEINRQFPVTVRLHDPFRSPLRGCSFQPGNRLSWSSISAVSRANRSLRSLSAIADGTPGHFLPPGAALALCGESGQVACYPFHYSSMYGYTVHVKWFIVGENPHRTSAIDYG